MHLTGAATSKLSKVQKTQLPVFWKDGRSSSRRRRWIEEECLKILRLDPWDRSSLFHIHFIRQQTDSTRSCDEILWTHSLSLDFYGHGQCFWTVLIIIGIIITTRSSTGRGHGSDVHAYKNLVANTVPNFKFQIYMLKFEIYFLSPTTVQLHQALNE